MDPNSPTGGGPKRFIRRDDPNPEDPWLSVNVDMKDPHTHHQMPPKRIAMEHVGGTEELLEILRASDRVRARFLVRDFKWINKILGATGLELAVLRQASE